MKKKHTRKTRAATVCTSEICCRRPSENRLVDEAVSPQIQHLQAYENSVSDEESNVGVSRLFEIHHLETILNSVTDEDDKVDVSRLFETVRQMNAKLCPRTSYILLQLASYSKVTRGTIPWLFYDSSSDTICATLPRHTLDYTSDQIENCHNFIKSFFPTLRHENEYSQARNIIRRHNGIETLRQWLDKKSLLNGDLLDTRKDAPFNLFALIGSGELVQTNMEWENSLLGRYKEKFVVARNMPNHDQNWDKPECAPRSSMGRHHRFLVLKDLDYHWFNAIAWGLEPDKLEDALKLIGDIKAAAKKYSKKMGWRSVGLFCHVFGHNSIHSCHIHMLDLLTLGPSYFAQHHKNCSLDTIERVLRHELREYENQMRPQGGSSPGRTMSLPISPTAEEP